MSRGSMESVLAALLGGGRRSASGPLGEAQQLMYQAWESPSRTRRLALAGKALEISPDCADAYVLLAQEGAASPAEAAELYRKAVDAGERALGKRAFKDDVGHFWGVLETRPYMRARAGLAQSLRAAGRTDEAIAHYRDMLRLNPGDNQGVRYDLAACLLDAGRDVDLAALLEQYAEDISAAWAYTRALLAFRTGGDSERSREQLAAARAANPHVPAYLLGRKKLPKRQPDYIRFGDDTEAIVYAADHAAGWKHTGGALDWLAAQERAGAKPRPA
jgi:tetratricopeptide (TPR) repeat protein